MSQRVLETDFPLMVPPNPPSLARSHSRERNSAHMGSMSRPHAGFNDRKPPPSEWQFQTRLMTAPNTIVTSPGRTGSLKKAYSESSSGADDEAGRAETDPLYPRRSKGQQGINVPVSLVEGRPSPQRSQTSDYHSGGGDPHTHNSTTLPSVSSNLNRDMVNAAAASTKQLQGTIVKRNTVR